MWINRWTVACGISLKDEDVPGHRRVRDLSISKMRVEFGMATKRSSSLVL